jgi:hypothetical protein
MARAATSSDDGDVDMVWIGDALEAKPEEITPLTDEEGDILMKAKKDEEDEEDIEMARSEPTRIVPSTTRENAHSSLDLSRFSRELPSTRLAYNTDGFNENMRRTTEFINWVGTQPYIHRFISPTGTEPVIVFSLYHSALIPISGKPGEYVRREMPPNTTLIQFSKTFERGYISTFTSFFLNVIKSADDNNAFYEFLNNPTRTNFTEKIVKRGFLDDETGTSNKEISGMHAYGTGQTYPELYCDTDPYFGEVGSYIRLIPGIYPLREIIEMFLLGYSKGIHTKEKLEEIEKIPEVKSKTDELMRKSEIFYSPRPGTQITVGEIMKRMREKMDETAEYRGRRLIMMHMGCKVLQVEVAEEVKKMKRAESVAQQVAGKRTRKHAKKRIQKRERGTKKQKKKGRTRERPGTLTTARVLSSVANNKNT